jgi:Holliday junction resolvase RusA-like endonuclease
MTVLRFSIDGNPEPKRRPRATVRGGHGAVYTDARTVAYERLVRQISQGEMAAAGLVTLTGPLSVSLRFRFAPAASLSKRKREALLSGEEPLDNAFDVDNLAKAVLDGMNSTPPKENRRTGKVTPAVYGVYFDDRQINRLWIEKVSAPRSGIDLRIEALSPQLPDFARPY